jgi:hypothetical protein
LGYLLMNFGSGPRKWFEGVEPPGIVFVRHVVSQKIGGGERQIQGGQVEVDALEQVL